MVQEEHCLVCGVSGGGKTTILREVHEEGNPNGPSITVNHRTGPGSIGYESGIAGYRASGREAMATAVGKFDSWEEVKINLKVDDVMEGVAMAVDFAVDIWDTAGVPVQIIIDECHHAIGEGMPGPNDNPAMWVLTEGRGQGIKGVFATQNPQALDYDYLLNIRYWAWVGEWASAQKAFLTHWDYPIEEMPKERFKYDVYNRRMETLYSAETKEKYGDGM